MAVSEAGRHRLVRPEDFAALSADNLEARLLGKPATMVRRDVSRGAEVSLLSARKFWHALGFPIVEDDDEMFTEADQMALMAVARLVREEELDETTALAMTRAFARTTDRLAVWQTQLMAEALADPALEAALDEKDARGAPDLAAAEAAARKLTDMADALEPLLIYAWRRHLTAAISRMLADADPQQSAQGVRRVVGFADLVNFTSLVRRMTERQLAVMVQRFEALATDIVTAHGGRVIKTVGDEILFVTLDAAPAAAVALDLVETMAEDDLLPDVRVGMAVGPVLSRLGDVFGTTVNRASRITSVAPGGGVLVDDALAAALAALSGFETTALRTRTLRGIGRVTPSELRRATGGRLAGRAPAPPALPPTPPPHEEIS
ncbi:adenylate/guanylate cyclase domain-containing protein [Pedococcus sp. KACC 23699]|uniref:Adenylate/guanylate cyclase domain-containing protein n=1 Tax=Pedococcus sp. KACC 23699 TaxID=3149228 RepID=A0AAU7JW03_9MICO